MQDLANRMEYYNQLITVLSLNFAVLKAETTHVQERQETYQRELLEAQARASNMNDDAEEVCKRWRRRTFLIIQRFTSGAGNDAEKETRVRGSVRQADA